MISREERLALANINPELEQIYKVNPPQGLPEGVDIKVIRAYLVSFQERLSQTSPESSALKDVVEEDRQIGPMRDGSTITARIHRPKNPPADGSPVFVCYHGGGFCLGDLESEVVLCRDFAKLGGVAVNVDYRLAPEHPFPVPVHDAFDALKWTAAHLDELKVNPAKGFLVGGISAGGNLSAVITHLYRDEGISPPLTGAYLSIPATCEPSMIPEKYKDQYLSREQNKDAPILGQATMALFKKLYKAETSSALRSPLIFPSHKDLPPTYFQICGLDPLRDEALIYEQVLREDYGIKTLVDLYPGLPHAFWSSHPTAKFTQTFTQDCVKGLKWLLEQSK